MKRTLFYLIPQSLRPLARKLYFAPIDLWQSTFGQRDDLVPPKGDIYVGAGDFKEQGIQFKKRFEEHGLIHVDSHILDVGSGIGRMAVPFVDYLSENGRYCGFDVVESGVRWCQENLTKRRANFEFVHANIYNELYNVSGDIEGEDYRFPYADRSFDFVFLTSVFTHMLPDEVAHYLQEISRVMKVGGKCFITYFVLNAESESLLQAGKSTKAFPHQYEHYALMDKSVDSANVAFKDTYLAELYGKNNLRPERDLYPGWWCGRAKNYEYQDYIIAEKIG